MVQDYLGGSTDGWTYALDRGRAYFTAPPNREVPNDFVNDARRLGTLTRELHEALGSLEEHAAFSPEPTMPEDLDRWALRAQYAVHEALTLLDRQIASPAFPRERLAEAQALLKRREHFIGWINEIADQIGEDLGLRIRTHGDYHLGQILRTKGGDFMVIDFEGEPSKPLDERREKTSPLRDVAGMLRSLAYAAATLAATDGRSAPPAVRELRAARWERDARSAFLGAYFAQVEEEYSILPESDTNSRQLVTLFEAEKAFYELAYELNNRPDWSWIPMRGISKLFVAK
jgi:maltose alpha-D-glucosyltransferase/alpha-amylase